MMFSQHLDGDSYRFSCSELESVEIFGKNPRWRRYFSKLRKLVFGLKFSKTEIFQKLLLRFVQPSNTKWRREPRWRISVDLFLKNCSKSTEQYFFKLRMVLFSEKTKL
jgi:hypothetical protein